MKKKEIPLIVLKYKGVRCKLILSNGFKYTNIVYDIVDDLIVFQDRNGEEICVEPSYVVMVTKVEDSFYDN